MKKTTIVDRSYEAGIHAVMPLGEPLVSDCLRLPSQCLQPVQNKGHRSRSMGEKILMAMKITTLLMLTVCLHVTAETSSQTITLTSEQMPLVKVFAEIKKQTGYVVFYTKDLLRNTSPASLAVKDLDLRSFMDLVLKDQPLKYKIADKTIILLHKAPLLFPTLPEPTELAAPVPPPAPIKGQVTDEEGKPLSNISVLIKGTAHGTSTDENGNFSFPDVKPGQTLVFSSVEVETRELKVTSGQSTLNVTLKRAVSDLNQVIVVGYGTMKKSDVNAAITTVKPSDLVKVSSPDFSQMLMGRAAGVTVTQGTAQPGGSLNILVRGAPSTGAGNQPLYVIDGFPVVGDGVSPGSGNQWNAGGRSPLNDINPNDIASIEILKDAAATAIYGARGASGVILITTKRGGGGQAKVEYSMNMSTQEVIKKPSLLTASEFLNEREKYNHETYLINNKLGPYGDTDPGTVAPYTPLFTPDDITAAGAGTNWYNLMTQPGIVNQHNITVTQGTKTYKSLFSVNYFDQRGVVKTSGIQRLSLRYNFDQEIRRWWNYGASAMASLVTEKNATLGGGRDATAGIIESAMNYSPLVKPQKTIDGFWIEDPSQALLNHPLSYLDITDKTKSKRFMTSLYTNVHFLQDVLWVKLSGGIDARNGKRQNYFPQTTRYGSQVGGDANINSASREDYLGEAVLNFQKSFGRKHKLLSLAGYSYQQQNDEGVYVNAKRFTSDALYYYRIQAGEERPIVSSYRGRHVLASYFTRMQYSFDQKYLFTFSARVDGSDRFGANNKYAFFPSAAFAWRAIEEDFIRNIDWVSDLKLRVSAGQVGNENLPNSAAYALYSFQGQNYYFDGQENKGVTLSKLANPNLRWETTSEINVGMDFGFLRNRLSGSLDVFYKEVSDLLSYRTLPHYSIVSGVYSNVGRTQSKGVELTLRSINLEGPLHWSSALTFTAYRDRWMERDPKVILRPYESGTDPLSSVFTLVSDGLKQPGEETPHMPGLLPGQMKYRDLNGRDADGKLTGKPDGRIDEADVVYLGTRAPKFTVGLNNTLSFGNFDLSMFWYAVVGAYKLPETRMEHSVFGSYGIQLLRDNYNFLSEIKDRWSSANPNATLPSGIVNSFDQYGSPYWEKASYARLKNLTIGYDLTRVLKPSWAVSARIFVTGENLATITNYNGFDPEVENDRASYPQQRSFSFGLDVKF